MAQLPRSHDDSGWIQWRDGRGGGGRDDSKAQAVNAMETEDTRQEGEPPVERQQVAAAASGGNASRGGGADGGRGRGPYTRPEWSEERKKLFAEDKCFYCKERGHQKSACLKLAAARQQSNGRAGQ